MVHQMPPAPRVADAEVNDDDLVNILLWWDGLSGLQRTKPLFCRL